MPPGSGVRQRIRYTFGPIRAVVRRTPSAATILAASFSAGLVVRGCGLERGVSGPRTANYRITLSIISPHIELATDGKEPALAPYSEAIAMVLRKACSAAYRAMGKPPGSMSIKDAAWQVMADAYHTASGGGRLPANARQMMYAARKRILELTGRPKLDDRYFTQTLLPDYVEQHPAATSTWDIVFDDRGNFIEPHTDRNVPLGTVEVRQYLGERPMPQAPLSLDAGSLAPTTGPENRYSAVLFVEKEGFNALLAQARIAERFDIAIMSTKGMSTTAARLLLDRLAPRIDKVLVAHDFDVSGFSIFGTLGSDGRRYRFHNDVHIVDLGLRLSDVEALRLDSEPVETSGDWSARAATLAAHGASMKEISFLRHRRVELNAMPADVFVRFLERKLAEHGIGKVVPGNDVLEQHARHVLTRALTNKALDAIRRRRNLKRLRSNCLPICTGRLWPLFNASQTFPGILRWQISPAGRSMVRRGHERCAPLPTTAQPSHIQRHAGTTGASSRTCSSSRLELAGKQLRNRVTHASMTLAATPAGRVTDRLIQYHANRAAIRTRMPTTSGSVSPAAPRRPTPDGCRAHLEP